MYVRTEYVLAYVPEFVIPFNLIYMMTKLNFELLTPAPQDWGKEVYRQNICYHFDACVTPFNLICNMTMF